MNWLSSVVVGGALFGLVGCGVSPGETSASTSGTGATSGSGGVGGSSSSGGTGSTGGGPSCPDDPADGPVSPECGIWVSASLGDDKNPGTQEAPIATLGHATDLAVPGKINHIYACAETFGEPQLRFQGHESLHGGFDCHAGWAYVGASKRSVLKGAPDSPALTWEAVDGYSPYLTDFRIEAADATVPSASSIGLYVIDQELWILRDEIIAGNGADGLDGESGSASPAAGGAPGNDGASACSAPVSKGGAPPQTACPAGDASIGGAGGDGGVMIASNGGEGQPAVPPPDGEGGLGEATALVCSAGNPGKKGADGAPGAITKTHGCIIKGTFVGGAGKDGPPGAPGQGGGGGGATFGKVAVCGAAPPGGAAGGSGGAGGCGGQGGKGGQPGGASLAILTDGLKLQIHHSALTAGKGGKGGNGGPPQPGGDGGPGGKGGAGAGSIKPGCAGGTGGKGGNGGWGGGGNGGPALCVAAPGTPDWDAPTVKCNLGQGGYPGASGPVWDVETGGWPGATSDMDILKIEQVKSDCE
jgi:hypothetical protein